MYRSDIVDPSHDRWVRRVGDVDDDDPRLAGSKVGQSAVDRDRAAWNRNAPDELETVDRIVRDQVEAARIGIERVDLRVRLQIPGACRDSVELGLPGRPPYAHGVEGLVPVR